MGCCRCVLPFPYYLNGPVEPSCTAAALLAMYAADLVVVLGQYLLDFRPVGIILVIYGCRSLGLGLDLVGGWRIVLALQEYGEPWGQWVPWVLSFVVDGILLKGWKIG